MSNYTGLFGLVEFDNGLSCGPVHWKEINRLASIIQIEDAENPGHQLGPVAELERNREIAADDPRVTSAGQGVHMNGEVRLAVEIYTRAELEALADARGLAGVRDLARAWGRTGRSIGECIQGVLDAQAAAGKHPAFIEAGSSAPA